MGSYKVEQRRLQHKGRQFHFVSYDGEPANPAKDLPGSDPSWFMMGSGKRWPAIPHQPGQDAEEVDKLLTVWLEENVFD
jgi:hypothetical protein